MQSSTPGYPLWSLSIVARLVGLRRSLVSHPGWRPAGDRPVGPPLSRPRDRLSASPLHHPLSARRAHRVRGRQQPCLARLLSHHCRWAVLAGWPAAAPDLSGGEPGSAGLDDLAAGPDVPLLQGWPDDLRTAALSPVHCSGLSDPAGARAPQAARAVALGHRGGSLLPFAFDNRYEHLQPGGQGRLESIRPVAEPRGATREKSMAPKAPVTVVVHPSDPKFPRDQVEAARYDEALLIAWYWPMGPARRRNRPNPRRRHSTSLASPPSKCTRESATFRTLDSPAPIWQRAATDWHQGVPELHGLIIRRRLGHVSGR